MSRQLDTTSNTELPLAPELNKRAEMEIYARFMRHLRHVPNSRMEIKILSAIQFTADMLDLGDDLIAKTLVDLGLRAPRSAFPSAYLKYADESLMRSGWEVGSPAASTSEIKTHWDSIGEDRFAFARADHITLEAEGFYVRN